MLSNHYVTKETTESLDSSSASLFETVARLAELGGVGEGFGLITLCQVPRPSVGRATRPTFIESFCVVRGSEDYEVGTSGSQLLVPGVSWR